jgi:hypothetical protein
LECENVKSHSTSRLSPEDGRYIRGNDASPVAVAIILNHDADKIPPEI